MRRNEIIQEKIIRFGSNRTLNSKKSFQTLGIKIQGKQLRSIPKIHYGIQPKSNESNLSFQK